MASEEYPETRPERRDEKRQSLRAKMEKHGRGLVQMYRDAVLKRMGKQKPEQK